MHLHTPQYIAQPNSDTLVIFIHGFMGGPSQFDDLLELAHRQGYAASSILLPGHGQSGREFAHSNQAQWQAHVQQEIDYHKTHYSHIYLVGHSMGGLLAVQAGLNADNRIRGLMLISTPLRLHNLRPDNLWRKLRLLLYPKGHEIKTTYLSANSIRIDNPLWLPLWLHPTLQLLKLMRQTRADLPRLIVPTLIIHSRADETVALSSADMFAHGLINAPLRRVNLEHSLHSYFTPQERQIIGRELLQMIAEQEIIERV